MQLEQVVSPDPDGEDAIALLQSTRDPDRWFLLQLQGLVTAWHDGSTFTPAGVALDIRDRVATLYYGTNPGFGAFGMALHPQFATNGQMFVYYTAETDPYEVHLSRFTSTDGGLTFDPDTEEILLAITLSDPKHLGGPLVFGPDDGYLYLGLGYNYSPDNAQDNDVLWGSVLRLDVDGANPYAIPPDNPFAAGGGLPEIWAWGFRNPWRFSFDATSHTLWAGDVGENAWEEVDRVERGGNYGWPIREGAHCYPTDPCDPTGLIDPVVEYAHTSISPYVVGGYVYRGTRNPLLRGAYLYADGDETLLSALYCNADGAAAPRDLLQASKALRSFAEGRDGELYLLYGDGAVARIAPGDSDGDGVTDDADNCTLESNASQRDSDGDGFGNVCDADLSGDCVVNFLDLAAMKAAFFSTDPNADLNGDGQVDFQDLGLMKAAFFGTPGPSGQSYACDPAQRWQRGPDAARPQQRLQRSGYARCHTLREFTAFLRDVNGDGHGDFIIGAQLAEPDGLH